MKRLNVFLRALGFLGCCLGILFVPRLAMAQDAGYRVTANPLYWALTSPEQQSGGGYTVHATEYGHWSKTPGTRSGFGRDIDLQYGLFIDGVEVAGSDDTVVSEDPLNPTIIMIDYVYPLTSGRHIVRFNGYSAYNLGSSWDSGDVVVNVP